MKAAILPVTPFQQNCTLIWNEETMIGDVDRVLDKAGELGVKVTKLLLTHGHLDHAGGAAELAERLSIPIEGPHRDDKFWIDKIAEQSARFGFDGARSFIPDRWLEDGDTVTVGGLELNVLHCPGHTPGHVIFYHRESRIAQVGDVLFQGSIGRTDFPRGDHGQLIESITKKLWPLGDDVTFVPGHGPTSTFGWERKTNPFVADLALG